MSITDYELVLDRLASKIYSYFDNDNNILNSKILDCIFMSCTEVRAHIHSQKYSSSADPYKRIHVDPTEIKLGTNSVPVALGLSQIRTGNWDNKAYSLEDNWIFQGIQQRYIYDRSWDDTIYVEKSKQMIEENGEFLGYSNVKDFKSNRCSYVDKLYYNMKENGYKPNHGEKEHAKRKGGHHDCEPLICIARNGDLILSDGRHRVAISNILNIDTIPVQILARHESWQLTRDIAANNQVAFEVDKDLQSHPDLADLTSY